MTLLALPICSPIDNPQKSSSANPATVDVHDKGKRRYPDSQFDHFFHRLYCGATKSGQDHNRTELGCIKGASFYSVELPELKAATKILHKQFILFSIENDSLTNAWPWLPNCAARDGSTTSFLI